MTTQGVQVWTTPYDATFKVTAAGARGGTGGSLAGGSGRIVSRTIYIPGGTKIHMVVGQEGGLAQDSSGGGGGTFVYIDGVSKSNAILVAGGGGGYGGKRNGADGSVQNATPGKGGGGSGGVDGSNGGGTMGGIGANSSSLVGVAGTFGVHGGFGGGGGVGSLQGVDVATGQVPSGVYYGNGGGGGGYGGGGGGQLVNVNQPVTWSYTTNEVDYGGPINYSSGGAHYGYKTATAQRDNYVTVTGPGGGGGSYSPTSDGYNNNVGLNPGSGYVHVEVISTPAPTQAPSTPAPTLAPTSAAPVVTPLPTSAPIPPPSYLRHPPNLVILVHEASWMNDGTLKVMTLRGSTPTIQPFAFKDLTQVFAIDANGSVRTVAAQGDYLNHATTCDGVIGGSNASMWRFAPRNLPRSYALEVVCSSTLGTKRIDYNAISNPWSPFLSASTTASAGWFVVPVARIDST